MAFNVKKHLIRVQGGREYLPVAYRLVWFREDHPDWGIDTKPVVIDVDKGVAVFQANVYNEEGRLLSSGTKMETARGFADFIEKAETGSIGRALGVLGYGTQFAPEFDEGDRIVDSPLPFGGQQPAPARRIRPAAAETRENRETAPAPNGSKDEAAHAGYATCAECNRPLTKGQSDYSTVRFGRPLCPTHQTRTSSANGTAARDGEPKASAA